MGAPLSHMNGGEALRLQYLIKSGTQGNMDRNSGGRRMVCMGFRTRDNADKAVSVWCHALSLGVEWGEIREVAGIGRIPEVSQRGKIMGKGEVLDSKVETRMDWNKKRESRRVKRGKREGKNIKARGGREDVANGLDSP